MNDTGARFLSALKLNVSKNDQPMAGNNVNVKSVIHDGATMAHNPEGTGLFRDPLDVLGLNIAINSNKTVVVVSCVTGEKGTNVTHSVRAGNVKVFPPE